MIYIPTIFLRADTGLLLTLNQAMLGLTTTLTILKLIWEHQIIAQKIIYRFTPLQVKTHWYFRKLKVLTLIQQERLQVAQPCILEVALFPHTAILK